MPSPGHRTVPVSHTARPCHGAIPEPDLRLTGDVFVMDLASGSVTELTDGTLSIGSIAFTPDGQYMLMLASDLRYAVLLR